MALNTKLKIIFFGSDKFSINVLQPIFNKNLYKIEVMTKPATELDVWAQDSKLKRHYWQDRLKEDSIEAMPNIGLVASFGNLIDIRTIQLFEYGLFNIHPSLLPRYRGSAPIQSAILNGDTYTGVTIFKIPPVEKFDIGDVVMQKQVIIERREYAWHLAERLAEVGSDMFFYLLQNYNQCLQNTRPQCSEGRSYAKKLKPEMGQINFRQDDSVRIDRKVRAFTDYIDLYFHWMGKKVKLYDLLDPKEIDKRHLDESYTKIFGQGCEPPKPGYLLYSRKKHALCIKCSDGEWLAFRALKIESKPKMTALEFNNGFVSKCTPEESITDL